MYIFVFSHKGLHSHVTAIAVSVILLIAGSGYGAEVSGSDAAVQPSDQAAVAAISPQATELQAKVAQAEAEQKAAATKAATLAAEAQVARATADQQTAAAARALQASKVDAPKDVAAKLKAQAQAAAAVKKQAVKAAKVKAKTASAAQRDLQAKAKATVKIKSTLASLRRKLAEQQAAEAESAQKAAEKQAQADLSRRSALAKAEASARQAALKKAAEKQAQADLSRRSALAKAEASARRAAAKKAAEEAKAKAELDALAKQATELQAKVAQAEAEQKAAATKAATLAAEAQAARATADQQTAAAARALQASKVDAPKDVAVKLKAQAQAAAAVQKQAVRAAKMKARKASAAQRDLKARQKATAKATASMERVTKTIADRQAAQAAPARQAAEQTAKADLSRRSALGKAEAKSKRVAEEKAARAAKVKARLESGLLGPTAGQPATEAQSAGQPPAMVVSKEDAGKWRVAVGVLYRRIGAQRFKTGSYSSGYVIGDKSRDNHWVGPAGVEGINGSGDRRYDDGYVGSDDYTDLDSGTWNWGYDSGRQVKGNTIEFSGVDRVWREYSRQTTVTEGESSDSADTSGGLMVEAERYMLQTRYVDCGVKLGVSREQTFQASVAGMNTFDDNQRWETYEDRVVDTYDLSGTGITPDSAPYRGNRTDKGPVIDTTPMSRRGLGSELVSVETYRTYNSISESLDMDLSTVSLGLSLKGKYRRVYVAGSMGPTLNLVEKDATYEETLYESANGGSPQMLQYWQDSSSGTEYLFGYYVQGEVGVRIYRGLQVGVFGRYDWLENVSGNVGQSRYEVNPAGGSMGGTVGVQF